jgi:hypothetical protein
VAGEKVIDTQKRIIRIAEWGAKYSYNQISEALENIDHEANISSLVALKNKNCDPKKNIQRDIKIILNTTNLNEVMVRQMTLQDMISSVYPEVKYYGRELKDYEPYARMNALVKLISGYKKISLNAYDKSATILNVLTFRSYVSATLPENDIHQKATKLLRENIQIS